MNVYYIKGNPEYINEADDKKLRRIIKIPVIEIESVREAIYELRDVIKEGDAIIGFSRGCSSSRWLQNELGIYLYTLTMGCRMDPSFVVKGGVKIDEFKNSVILTNEGDETMNGDLTKESMRAHLGFDRMKPHIKEFINKYIKKT